MAAITVRGLDDDVHRALMARARRNGRSMESEVRSILSDEVRADLMTPNILVEFYLAHRNEPIDDLPVPARGLDEPRVVF